jgi:hypothetical protein
LKLNHDSKEHELDCWMAYHASFGTSLLRLEKHGLFVVAPGASLVRPWELWPRRKSKTRVSQQVQSKINEFQQKKDTRIRRNS